MVVLLLLLVSKDRCLGEVLVTGTVRGIGLDGGGYLVISLGLGPGNGVDKVECSLAGSCVSHGNVADVDTRVGVNGVQLLLLLLVLLLVLVLEQLRGLGVAGCRHRRVEMRRR